MAQKVKDLALSPQWLESVLWLGVRFLAWELPRAVGVAKKKEVILFQNHINTSFQNFLEKNFIEV